MYNLLSVVIVEILWIFYHTEVYTILWAQLWRPECGKATNGSKESCRQGI